MSAQTETEEAVEQLGVDGRRLQAGDRPEFICRSIGGSWRMLFYLFNSKKESILWPDGVKERALDLPGEGSENLTEFIVGLVRIIADINNLRTEKGQHVPISCPVPRHDRIYNFVFR